MEGQENLHKLNILIKRVDIAPPPLHLDHLYISRPQLSIDLTSIVLYLIDRRLIIDLSLLSLTHHHTLKEINSKSY